MTVTNQTRVQNEFQFAECRLPSLAEINAIAPDSPVFVLHLYDRALLNGAALRACGYFWDTPNPPGGEIQRDKQGHPTGMLIARPNAAILYASLAKGPKLQPELQANATRQFMRELNRLGVTSCIDAGGGFQNYPDDYKVIEDLHRRAEMTVCVILHVDRYSSLYSTLSRRRCTGTELQFASLPAPLLQCDEKTFSGAQQRCDNQKRRNRRRTPTFSLGYAMPGAKMATGQSTAECRPAQYTLRATKPKRARRPTSPVFEQRCDEVVKAGAHDQQSKKRTTSKHGGFRDG